MRSPRPTACGSAAAPGRPAGRRRRRRRSPRRRIEVLGDKHVLPLGRDLHDAVWPGRADPDVLQQAQGIVLVLGQAPHGLEGVLVLQGAVQDWSAPACTTGRRGRAPWCRAWRTGTCLEPPSTRSRSGVEPAEDSRPTGVRSVTVSPSWSRTPWRMACAAPAGHVHVRGATAPVGDREHLVWREETERG